MIGFICMSFNTRRRNTSDYSMSHLTLILFDIDSGLFIVEIHNCYKKKRLFTVKTMYNTLTIHTATCNARSVHAQHRHISDTASTLTSSRYFLTNHCLPSWSFVSSVDRRVALTRWKNHGQTVRPSPEEVATSTSTSSSPFSSCPSFPLPAWRMGL